MDTYHADTFNELVILISKLLPQLRNLYSEISKEVNTFKEKTGKLPIYRPAKRISEKTLWVKAMVTRDLLRRTLVYAGNVKLTQM